MDLQHRIPHQDSMQVSWYCRNDFLTICPSIKQYTFYQWKIVVIDHHFFTTLPNDSSWEYDDGNPSFLAPCVMIPQISKPIKTGHIHLRPGYKSRQVPEV